MLGTKPFRFERCFCAVFNTNLIRSRVSTTHIDEEPWPSALTIPTRAIRFSASSGTPHLPTKGNTCETLSTGQKLAAMADEPCDALCRCRKQQPGGYCCGAAERKHCSCKPGDGQFSVGFSTNIRKSELFLIRLPSHLGHVLINRHQLNACGGCPLPQ
jgi:hypothetical protein